MRISCDEARAACARANNSLLYLSRIITRCLWARRTQGPTALLRCTQDTAPKHTLQYMRCILRFARPGCSYGRPVHISRSERSRSRFAFMCLAPHTRSAAQLQCTNMYNSRLASSRCSPPRHRRGVRSNASNCNLVGVHALVFSGNALHSYGLHASAYCLCSTYRPRRCAQSDDKKSRAQSTHAHAVRARSKSRQQKHLRALSSLWPIGMLKRRSIREARRKRAALVLPPVKRMYAHQKAAGLDGVQETGSARAARLRSQGPRPPVRAHAKHSAALRLRISHNHLCSFVQCTNIEAEIAAS